VLRSRVQPGPQPTISGDRMHIEENVVQDAVSKLRFPVAATEVRV
jgi:hypothetical protein